MSLDIDRDSENARLAQERELEIARAVQRSDLARERAEHEQQAERAQITSREQIERARIATDRTLEEDRIAKERGIQALEIERRQHLEIAEQQRAIAIAGQSRAQSEAQAEADLARALSVTAEEKVFTARETEVAERRRQIDLIGARQEADRDALRLTSAAEAEKHAAADRGAALKSEAQAEADAEKIRALASKIRAEVEAEGVRLMNEARNILSPQASASALRMRLLEKVEGIVRESVKPMERIENIRILHVDGLGGGGSNGGAPGENGGGLADNVVNSALRYRAQAPLVDMLLKEIGLQGGDIGRLSVPLAPPEVTEGGKPD
jgi:uncharacterized membrane protein YqiK